MDESNEPDKEIVNQTTEETNNQPTLSSIDGLNPNVAPTNNNQVSSSPESTHKNKIKIALLIIVVALLIIGGAVAWLITHPSDNKKDSSDSSLSDSNSQQKNTDSGTTLATDDSASNILKAINNDLRKAGLPTQDVNQDSSQHAATSPAYKPDGYNFYVRAKNISGIYVTNDTNSNSEFYVDTTRLIGSTLLANDFHSEQGLPPSSSASKNVVCETLPSRIDDDHNGLIVSCIDKTELTATASLITDMVTAYKNSDEGASQHIDTSVFYPYKVDSNTNDKGYLTAEISTSSINEQTGGAILLFYQHQQDGWKFFAGTQNTLTCDKYNTTELKDAYHGVDCYSGDKLQKV